MDADSKVAIVGIALRLPGADTVADYWNNLLAGTVSITQGPGGSGAANFVPYYGSIEGRGRFAYEFFKLSRREAELMDPQQRLLIECAWELLEAIGPGSVSGYQTGVFTGTTISTYLHNCMRGPLIPNTYQGFEVMLACDKDYSPARISHKLGFTGPSIAVQTGCSTSLVAVHLACQSILTGESDVAFAGGACIQWVPLHGHFYTPGHVYSPDGMCRAFDAEAEGTTFGDGVGLVALKRLDLALQDGDDVLAVVRGTATNNSGSTSVGFTAPSYRAQRALLEQAYANAQVSPGSVGLVETHGAGTRLGDPIEFEALRDVFAAAGGRGERCALGAVKANIGHLASAAGIAGLIKAVLAVWRGIIPPHPLFVKPGQGIELDGSPFFINTQSAPWQVSGERYAGVSSFGVGGSNAHVVLEGPPDRGPSAPERPCRVRLSAHSRSALERFRRDLATHIEAFPDVRVTDVAHTLAHRRSGLPVVLEFRAEDRSDLLRILRDEDLKGPTTELEPVSDVAGDRAVALPVPHLEGEVVALPEVVQEAADQRARLTTESAAIPLQSLSASTAIDLFEKQVRIMRSQLMALRRGLDP